MRQFLWRRGYWLLFGFAAVEAVALAIMIITS
jgi:hypothetical protein